MDKIAGGAGVATTRLGGVLRSCKIKVKMLTPGRRERRGKEGVKDPTGNVQKENSQIEILFVCLLFSSSSASFTEDVPSAIRASRRTFTNLIDKHEVCDITRTSYAERNFGGSNVPSIGCIANPAKRVER